MYLIVILLGCVAQSSGVMCTSMVGTLQFELGACSYEAWRLNPAMYMWLSWFRNWRWFSSPFLSHPQSGGKLRGEEKVLFSSKEKQAIYEKGRLQRCLKKAINQQCEQTAINQQCEQTVKKLQEQLDKLCKEHPNLKEQADAKYSSGGDKYRLTLVTISGVKNWFKHGVEPEPYKPRQGLLVPCNYHCRLDDISPEGTWTVKDIKWEI